MPTMATISTPMTTRVPDGDPSGVDSWLEVAAWEATCDDGDDWDGLGGGVSDIFFLMPPGR